MCKSPLINIVDTSICQPPNSTISLYDTDIDQQNN